MKESRSSRFPPAASRSQVSTPTELAGFDPKEPTLYIYYTDNARLIPIRLEAGLAFGTISATLIKECGPQVESCLLGLKD